MSNYQFLQKYLALQKEIMFDEFYDLGFATVCYCKADSSSFWNNALTDLVLSPEQVNVIESKLVELKREPAIYFENRSSLTPLVQYLESRKYKLEAEDSFMFYEQEEVDQSRFDQVKKVETTTELDEYLHVFDKCYQNDDPKNPYGELGEYLDATRMVWMKHHASNRIEYFIAYKLQEPVAVAALTNYDDLGYISNVGSLRSVRGEGFGKLVTLYCVHKSMEHGNKIHALITEEGTNPNAFYKSLGFKTKFTAKLMVNFA